MKPLVALLLSIFAVAFSSSAGAGTPTHCKKGEVTYFSCKLQRSYKVVSLCGSQDIENSSPGGWLQYRFGSVANPEFTFPPRKENSITYFKGYWSQHKPISAQDTWGLDDEVTFQNEGVVYSVLVSRYEGEFYGVSVSQSGKNTSLPCQGLSATVYGQQGDSNRKFSSLVRALPSKW